jgi:polyhydroxybutyrate depolymerase
MNKKLFILLPIIVAVLLVSGCIKKEREKPSEPTSSNFTLGPGDYDFSLVHDGLERKYLVHVPIAYKKSNPVPFVLAFHGGMGDDDIMAQYYGWIPKSDKEGFIIAFPNGVSRLPSGKLATWNAGNCCGYAVESNSDDVGFVKAVISDIDNKFNIDNAKIYATGMSNGGMMSYRLACEMSDTFAAIASVAGTDNYNGCNPKKPISIMHIHGLKDDHVLFYGGCGPACRVGSETEFVSVPDTISKWVDRNNCDKNPQSVVVDENAHYDLYSKCDGGTQVKVYVIKDGGHSWPGTEKAPNPLEKSMPSQAISATDEIWKFFTDQQ